MEDEEVDVQALLQRTRRNRENLNRHLAEIGESPKSLRSPLREVSSTNHVTSTSPSKTQVGATKSSSSSPLKSPSKSSTSFERSKSYERTTSDENRETFTKTTITEREEKVHKTEVVKFTEVRNGRGTPSGSQRMRELAAKFDVYVDPVEEEDSSHMSKKVTFLTPSKLESSCSYSPMRDEGLRSDPIETVNDNLTVGDGEEVERKASSGPDETAKVTSTEIKTDFGARESKKSDENGVRTILTPARREVELDDIGESGRRRRFAQLANKFKDYEASPSFDDSNASITKEIDVDEELEKDPSPAKSFVHSPTKKTVKGSSPMKAGSPIKTPIRIASEIASGSGSTTKPASLNKDPGFISKLKAHGFEETSSKSKLVYDFKEKRDHDAEEINTEPKGIPMERLPSPKKTASSSTSKGLPRTGLSPARQSPAMKPHSPPSPFKPHPLQFVSPQVNEAIGRARSPSPTRSRPLKPPRTFVEESRRKSDSKTYVLEETNNTDTASRRTMGEKKTLFEDHKAQKASPSVDPAMLPLSQRRALFEQRGSTPLPKPIARFGEPVTPAMLQKRSPIRNVERKREASRSPVRTFIQTKLEVDESHKWVKSSKNEEGDEEPSEVSMSVKETQSPKRSPSGKPHCRNDKRSSRSPVITANDDRRLDSEKSRFSPNKRESESKTSATSISPKQYQTTSGSCLGWKRRLEQSTPSAQKRAEAKVPATTTPSYPGVGSLKRLKVSPPKEGQLYPQVEEESSVGSRPSTSMSNEGSEAPSLGAVIRNVAVKNSNKGLYRHEEMESEDDESMDCDDLGEMLDEALDNESNLGRSVSTRTIQSAASWEYHTPPQTTSSISEVKRFKTPTVDAMEFTPPSALPNVDDDTNEGKESSTLTHTVSFYRRLQNSVTTPQSEPRLEPRRRLPDIAENDDDDDTSESDLETARSRLQSQVTQLREEAYKQEQQMEQASKALNFCVTRDEFEGSAERVEGERLLLEATHKHGAIMAEIRRLSTDGAIGHEKKKGEQAKGSKGTICISGLSLPMKGEFIKLIRSGIDEFVHFFVVLVKHRSRVIATQMLSSMDARERGKLSFPNLIKLNDLDLDFQIYVEVYGLQTRKEHLSHEEKYGLRKDKSVFNLTPLKKKRQDSSHMNRHSNPVNSKTIRRPAFGLVGYAVLNLTTLKSRAFFLEKVPQLSPLQGDLEMTLTIHSESTHKKRGFLTLFSEAHGYGDWLRRWCRLDRNALFFWKYPEDEKARKEPLAIIHLSQCVTDSIGLAPREICSRMNTFMFETRRDNDIHERHLLSADSRDERLEWCEVLNSALHNIRAWDPKAFRPSPHAMESDASSSTDGNTTDTLSSVSTQV